VSSGFWNFAGGLLFKNALTHQQLEP